MIHDPVFFLVLIFDGGLGHFFFLWKQRINRFVTEEVSSLKDSDVIGLVTRRHAFGSVESGNRRIDSVRHENDVIMRTLDLLLTPLFSTTTNDNDHYDNVHQPQLVSYSHRSDGNDNCCHDGVPIKASTAL
jgi:hypothetical protein